MASMMREAALFYLRRGWSVFPISPVSKKPLVDWYDYKSRFPTEQEIQQWWQKYPAAGVGIVTGKLSGLVVLDVDPKHGADPNHIYKTFPTTLVAQTGGGGGHFYYEYPKSGDVFNSVGKKNGRQTGYDIRGEGGYVVAPPSLHPSGRRYEWLDTGKKPSPIPPKLLEMAQPKGLNGSAESKEPWLADALRGVGEGARDDTAARLAGYYLSKGIPVDVVIENLKLWNQNNDQGTHPFTDADIEKVVHSVQKTRSRHPTKTPTGRDLEDSPQDLLRLVSLHQYMAQYGEEDVSWAIEGWLPDHTVAMMVSPPGTYKTWILIDLAVSVATGTRFLGSADVRRAGPVLIYQQEDFHGQMAQRIGTIMAARFKMGWEGDVGKEWTVTLPPSPPIYLHDNRELRFDNKEVMDVLEARIAELRPVTVIVDPLYTAAPMDDYMAKAVPHMMRLKKIRDRYGCSFVIAHHTGKRSGSDGKTSREDLWGSQFLNAFLETGWQIRPKGKGMALVGRHFKVTRDIEEAILTFDIETTAPTRYVTTLGEPSLKDDIDIKIINALDENGPMKGAKLAKLLGVSKSTVSRQMRALLASGTVRYDRDNNYRSAEHFNVTETEAE